MHSLAADRARKVGLSPVISIAPVAQWDSLFLAGQNNSRVLFYPAEWDVVE
jgi:hypothetical protein